MAPRAGVGTVFGFIAQLRDSWGGYQQALSKPTKGEQAGTLSNPQSTSFETDLKFEENRHGEVAQMHLNPNVEAGAAQQKDSISYPPKPRNPFMKSRFSCCSSFLIMLSLTGCAVNMDTPKRDQPGESALYGSWHVAGVAVSDSGVQALEDNDPSFMGRRLSFNHDQLAWKASAGSTEDVCKGPVFHKLPTISGAELEPQLHKLGIEKAVPYGVECTSGSWGPLDKESPVFFLAQNGSLALSWYDGGMLKLVRD
ncbi:MULTISPECIES: hypothetical protein [Pseudomonas syringae group]|nr:MULTISPECIES: hypothetical protein [Pseudomonas syringae group]